MSKTRKEATHILQNGLWWDYLPDDMSDADMNPLQDALDVALKAIRPITREQVEKVWRGEWQMVSNGSGVCSECHRQDKIDPLAKFCRYCGAPMTGEAVDMVMERLEALKDEAETN